MSQQDDKEFKKVEKVWYDKLKKEGFKDIEDISLDWRPLKEWDTNFFRSDSKSPESLSLRYSTTIQYYERARELLMTYEFKNEAQKKIWELHCEGLTERAIAAQVRVYKKSAVHYVVSKISRMIKKD